MDQVQLTLKSEVQNCETVKDIVLSTLLNDKIITEDQYEEYNSKYGFVLLKPSWYDKIFKSSETMRLGDWEYRFIKLK